MRPSQVLKIYCLVAFGIGTTLSLPIAMFIRSQELSGNSAIILTFCWNTLLLLILPLVLDWSEHKYFKARFLLLEELSETNPELKMALEEQCRKLALPGLRLALVDSQVSESFAYGLWRQNPRLVVPASWLASTSDPAKICPSLEVELARFARRDLTLLFAAFAVGQVIIQQILLVSPY